VGVALGYPWHVTGYGQGLWTFFRQMLPLRDVIARINGMNAEPMAVAEPRCVFCVTCVFSVLIDSLHQVLYGVDATLCRFINSLSEQN
jgi:hypothetical protein